MSISIGFLAFSALAAIVAGLKIDPIPLFKDEGELWTKNLKYQPVSAFWSTKPSLYLAVGHIFVYANNLKLRCGHKPSCFCYESAHVVRFLQSSTNFTAVHCPVGYAFICFTAVDGAIKSSIRIDVPGRHGSLGYDMSNSPLSPSFEPRVLGLRLEGGVVDLYNKYKYLGAEVPMFKHFYGYREDSDIPEPVVRLSTAGCHADMRLLGVEHGPIYSSPSSERKRLNASKTTGV